MRLRLSPRFRPFHPPSYAPGTTTLKKDSTCVARYGRYSAIRCLTPALLMLLTVCWPLYVAILAGLHHPEPRGALRSLFSPGDSGAANRTRGSRSNRTHISSELNRTFTNQIRVDTSEGNRTLVVLTGNLRGGEEAWRSLYQHVLDVNHADLALLIGATPLSYTNASLFQRATYVWTVEEQDDWANAMEQIEDKDVDWKQRLFGLIGSDPRENILLGAAGHIRRGSGAIVFMFRWYLANYIQQLQLTDRYDRFVVTRADHYYQCTHNLSLLDPQYLWVPEGEDYFGICDRHFVANSSTILAALNIFPALLKDPERYRRVLQSKHYNTESFLLLRWYEQGLGPLIRRFQRNMLVVATAVDGTRWGKPVRRQILLPGLYVKYMYEYYASSQTCSPKTVAHRKLVGVPGYVSKPSKRVLVVIVGNLTGNEVIWNTLYENVVKVNGADLALFVPSIPYRFRSSLRRRAKYLWGVPTFTDLADAMELVEEKDPAWRTRLLGTSPRPGQEQGLQGTAAVNLINMWFLSEQLKQHQMPARYDRFVVSRSDYYYRCAHELSLLDPSYLWAPTGEHYHHVSDFHLVANKRTILPALNVLPPLVQNPGRYRLLLSSEKDHADSLLPPLWRQVGLRGKIRFFDPMFVATTSGNSSRGNLAINLTLAPDVFIRYPEEYSSSWETCLARVGNKTSRAVQ